jgi:hypothetical protein
MSQPRANAKSSTEPEAVKVPSHVLENQLAERTGRLMGIAETLSALASASPPFVTRDHKAEKDAWVRLARGRMHRSIEYRRWALEAAAAGKLDKYREYRAEARRAHDGAWNALTFARLEASYA